ncbi:MAG: hypothetical protein NZL90_00755 [Aquificaceae bacterium]|nr:hypothetical protein [Aquificaceae bacterium]MDW8236984.1 hypothetical protein [Aquificaceae bacterium]
MIEKSWLDEIQKRLQNSMVNPDIELELVETEKSYPFFRVRYIVEGHDVYTKDLELSACKGMTPEQAADFLSFQIQQFMDEIDSTEYGGE